MIQNDGGGGEGEAENNFFAATLYNFQKSWICFLPDFSKIMMVPRKPLN